MTIELPASLREFISAQNTLTLATLNADGTPHACDLFYAHADDLTFYFLSDPKTAHIRNLEREPRVSAALHGASRGWQEIRGVQVGGTARRVAQLGERARGYSLYIAKFAFVSQWLPTVGALGQLHKSLGVVELYQIAPHWVRWIDNTQGFGHKEEFLLPGEDRIPPAA